jgi:hypothetical protein
MKDCKHKNCFYRIKNNGNGEETNPYNLCEKCERR